MPELIAINSFGYLYECSTGERYYADAPTTDDERRALRAYRQRHGCDR